MKRFHQTFHRVIPVLLLTAASSFAGTIGSLMEATADASMLIETNWGLRGGSFILSLDQLNTSTGVTVVPPTVKSTENSVGTPNATASIPAAPVFITQPNLGFQVVLTADYSPYQGPETPIDNPGKIVLAIIPSEPSSLGVSNEFTDSPISNELSFAGMLFMGDSITPPTILTSSAPATSRPASATPTADSSTTNTTTSYSQGERVAAAAAIASVPEPSTSIGVSLALLGLGWMKFRSKRG